MMGNKSRINAIGMVAGLLCLSLLAGPALGQIVGPTMLDPGLTVRTVIQGLDLPTSVAFLGPDDFLVLEKNTGRVVRVVNGVITGAVLDLAVNFASERGLLGIALHPRFPTNNSVYIYWTQSTTGLDTSDLAAVRLLGNRVDRYLWNGSTLTFQRNIIRLRAFQNDAGQALRGNHNGGVLRFGPDGKLYVFIGDENRRGQTQNLPDGPFGPGVPDDAFGGPQPDRAHLSGVILRLNPNGTAPSDNPFFNVGATMGGEVGASIQKIFAYGLRNSFGMAFDPISGSLWAQENGRNAFDEINLVDPGMNGGWIQIMGPARRIADYKSIELTMGNGTLGQIRWPASNLADTPRQALSRLFVLPGSQYKNPEFSWKFAVAPAGIGFVTGQGLGPRFQGDLFVGAANGSLAGGYLFRFNLTPNRRRVAVSDPRLSDRVADNLAKGDVTESESLLIGSGFGSSTDIQTGPNGNLFVVSLSNGAVFEISAAP